MATVPSIDYTDRDYNSILQELKDRIPFYLTEWTDFNDTDLGIVIIALFAGIADQLHFQLDRHAGEAFLDTALTRPSVIKLLTLINYSPPSAVPSTVDLTFSITATLLDPVTIPEGTECQTAGSPTVFFETTAEAIIPAGLVTVTAGAREGQSFSEELSISTGLAYQEYALSVFGVIDTSVEVYIDEGTGEELWAEVETFVDQGPFDKAYTQELTPEGFIKILFGDGGQGKIPLTDATIRSDYRVGGGATGNVGAGTITEVNDTILHLGSPLSIEVINAEAATGGLDEESIADAKRKGPQSLRTRWGLITEEDYADAAESVDGVAKAVAVGRGYRIVDIYIAPAGGGLPSQQLKDDVADYIETRKIVTTEINVLDPVYVSVSYTGVVYVRDNFVQSDVQADIETAQATFFSFDEREFADGVRLSDTYASIDNLEGVNYLDLSIHTMVPVVTETIWSSDATVGTFVIGPLTENETWAINFTGASEFTVSGAVAGLQTATGTVNSPYLVDDGSFGFTITLGATSPVQSDNGTIRVSKQLGNVILLANEIAQEGTLTLIYSGGAT